MPAANIYSNLYLAKTTQFAKVFTKLKYPVYSLLKAYLYNGLKV
jgi:hypothetical protein